MVGFDSFLDVEAQKAQIEIQKNEIKQIQKMYMKNQIRLCDEAEREIKKSQCDIVEFQEDGKVIAKTLNLRVDAIPRAVTNVEYPEMIKLVNTAKPTEFVWMFVGCLNSEWKQTFLSPDKVDSVSYLSKKLSGIGIEFYARTYADERWIMKKFVRKLIHNSSRYKWIPEKMGWYVDEDGSVNFNTKEERTWLYVLDKLR